MVWVPGHQGITGNEKADECAVRGLSLDEATACNDFMTPPVVVANKIDDWALHEFATRWSTINTCRKDAERMGYPRNDLCMSCLDEEEELVQHLLCDCPASQGL